MSLSGARPRLLLALLVAIVATAGVATALGPTADAPATAAQVDGEFDGVVPGTNTTGYLHPGDDPNRTESYARSDVDVAGALAASEHRLHGRHAALTVERSVDAAADADERATVLAAELDALERDTATLEARYRRAAASYAAGERSPRSFLRAVVRVEATADRYERRADGLEAMLAETDVAGSSTFQTRLVNLRADLVHFSGPVSEAVRAGATGADHARSVYMQATGDGVVLATADETTFHRQAWSPVDRNRSAPNRFAGQDEPRISLAYSRAAELYPWSFEQSVTPPSARGYGSTAVYRIDIDHAHGELVSYIDGGTTNVFAEEQTNNPRSVPTTTAARASAGDLDLSVETSAPTGPMTISVTGADGAPVDATVTVDGTVVGTTGPDGQLRAVQPRDRFEVNATAGGETVTATAP